MKKSLFALAAMAVAASASAQSSLNVYGVADVVVHKDKGVSTKMTSGGVSGSRLGFKGTEDLGGGLKANFLLEEGIDLTSGAAAGFNRQAYVGLSGGFGEVKFGNVYTAYDDISGATNPVFDSVLAPTAVWATTGYKSNPGSNIYYASPSFGGFSGAVSYNLDGLKKAVKSVNFKYENGAIYLGAAYQDERDLTGKRFGRLNGSYDFGSFKLLAGYGKGAGVDANEYSVGADVPLASNLVLSAGYASSKQSGAARKSGLGLGVAYLLSKRTTVYGGFLDTKNSAPDSRFGAGVKHTF